MLRVKVVMIAVLAALMGTLIILNTPYLNGPGFWAWTYRPIPAAPIYLSLALASIPFFVAQWIDARWRRLRWAAILLMMGACFGMKLASIAFRDDVTAKPSPNLDLITIIVDNPVATSYYTDALAVSGTPLKTWMILYPELMPQMHLHSQSKPPGPILFWFILLKLMGNSATTALTGGLLLGALGTLSIPATYLFLRHLLGKDDAAFSGASFLALCPGFVLFFPMIDSTYILLSTAMIGFWYTALRTDRIWASIALGAVLALTCLITFNILVIGLFMAIMPWLMWKRINCALRHGVVALGTTVVILMIVWITIGYNPIATFASAWRNQQELLKTWGSQRPWPDTAPWDLVDFALGAGYLSVALLVFWLIAEFRGPREPAAQRIAPDEPRPHISPRALVILSIVQFTAVAALGLLQLETARVWNFMLPLLMIPVGLELSGWGRAARLVPYAGLVFITAAVCQNLKWIY